MIKNAQKGHGVLVFEYSQNVLINHVTITEIGNIPGINVMKQSTITADDLTINNLQNTLVAMHDESKSTIRNFTIQKPIAFICPNNHPLKFPIVQFHTGSILQFS